MKIYHICDCCDRIYKVTETTGEDHDGARFADLTDNGATDIINSVPEIGSSFVAGLCDDCRDEMYGPAGTIAYPYRLH